MGPATRRATSLGVMAMAVAFVAAARPVPAGAQPLDIVIEARALQPGEVFVASFAAGTDATAGLVRAFGQTFSAFQSGNGVWRAVIGIDLDHKPGRYPLEAEAGGRSGARVVIVHPKQFRTRRLTVAPEFVEPPPDVSRRIADEAALLRDLYAASAPERLWNGPFVRPVPGEASSTFGSRSVYNGQPRSPHAGTDFAGAIGTPIQAPNGGRVALARELFFTGNTVIIDHGLGLLSVLAHLSRMNVEEGQSIASGQVVGLIGATGRVTGPHLHWSLRVGSARVDPLAALAIIR